MQATYQMTGCVTITDLKILAHKIADIIISNLKHSAGISLNPPLSHPLAPIPLSDNPYTASPKFLQLAFLFLFRMGSDNPHVEDPTDCPNLHSA